MSWSSGASLVVPQPGEIVVPVGFINEHRITHWFSVPSVVSLARRLRSLRPGCMPELSWSLFAGEQLTFSQAKAWLAAAPNSTLDNLYGPTELTITCTCYRLPTDPSEWPVTSNGTVPIGHANPRLEAVLLTQDGVATHDGELCVRGPQRFHGYLDPAENESRFLDYSPDSPAGGAAMVAGLPERRHWYRTGDRVKLENGVLVHVGRLDDQVKIHGFRIELGEIESMLRQHPGVLDVVVLAVASQSGDQDLYALYTGEGVREVELAELASRHLPAYMSPRRFLQVDSFPTNSNGKLDRRRLAHEAGLAGAP